mgnify:CR=1 FL=1
MPELLHQLTEGDLDAEPREFFLGEAAPPRPGHPPSQCCSARRRRLIREVLVAGFIAMACIMAGALSYVYVNDIVIFPDSGEEEDEAQEEAAGARAFTRGVQYGWNTP